MKLNHRLTAVSLVSALALGAMLLTAACSGGSSGSTRVYTSYGAGYRGFYRRPWGYPPAYIGDREVDPDWGVEAPSGPVALPMPDMGMPDFDMMDMGSFDW